MVLIPLSAQTVPWVAPAASLNEVPLIVDCIPQADGQTLTEGDYIGIFSDSGRCFGLARWKDTTDFKITVYGSDGSTDGFETGDPLNLKIWLSSENCILENISQVESDNPLVFSNTAVNSVNVLNFERINVYYPKDAFCLNEQEIVPLTSHPVSDLIFQPVNGLTLDPATGSINTERALPGEYTIALNTGMCLTEDNLHLTLKEYPRLKQIPDTVICGDALPLALPEVYSSVQWSTGENSRDVILTESGNVWYTVTNDQMCSNSDTFRVEKMDIASVNYRIRDADCYQRGGIEILGQVIENGKPPYTYKVTNRIDNTVARDLNNLPEGAYLLEIVNENGCVLRYRQTLIVEKDCLADRPVISPNEDGLDDRYFIRFEGPVRIFDRNGNLKRRLAGPVYFDGNDSNGNPLPMGTYLVVSDKGENITLTIIR